MIGAIFVDGGNASFSLKRKGGDLPERIDYALLPKYVRWRINRDSGASVGFPFKCYYAGYRDQADIDQRRDFSNALKREGWSVFDVQAKYINAEGRWKDDQVDMAMALDAYDLVLKNQLDALVLLTHDSDFAALFKRVPRRVLRYVMGWTEWVAPELTSEATLIPLDEAMKEVGYARQA